MSDEALRWLLIDSCGAAATLAVGRGECIVATEALPGREFSAQWPGAMRRLIARAAIALQELQVVGVVHGPGSFTGVRVGLAAAKGLCESVGAKLIAFSRLEVLASLGKEGALVALDAGRNEFYVRDCETESLWTREELLAASQQREVVTADIKVRELLGERESVTVVTFEPTSALPILLMRCREGDFGDVLTIDANYVRGESDIYPRKPGAISHAN